MSTPTPPLGTQGPRRLFTRTSTLEHRLRIAGLLICVGLVVQLLTLVRIHPLAFMAFLLIGCPLILGGVLLYLYSIVHFTSGAES